jgi:flavin reductase (DIM6/NTAB) family NADH-FMN oxidoreductase RutF
MISPSALRRLVRPLPQWSAVALPSPQTQVRIQLRAAGLQRDVTQNLVVASLRPLTFAIGLSASLKPLLEPSARAELRFLDEEASGLPLGLLRLRAVRVWRTAESDFGLFEVEHGEHRCLSWPRRPWNRWLQNRTMRKNRDPYNFAMPPQAVEQLMIFYICPRPVVLVSVDDGVHSNIFPLDLIGPIDSGWFTLALRSTSVSVETMKSSRRVALSSIAGSDCATVYRLGVHHRKPAIDWDQMPFKLERSTTFSLPVPAIALRVREVEICDYESIGSHTLFATRVVSDQLLSDAPQLFHTSGLHQEFRTRRGRRFAMAGA